MTEYTTDQKRDALGEAAGTQAIVFVIAAVLVALISYGGYLGQKGTHRKQAHDAVATANRNHFWKQLAREEPYNTKQPWGRLARDISPLLDPAFVESIPISELLPKTIDSINVPDGQYGELHKDLGFEVLDGLPIGEDDDAAKDCIDCGHFDDGFVAKATVARTGDWKRFQDKIPTVDTNYEFSFGQLPLWLFYLVLYLTVSSLSFVAAWINADAGYYRRTPGFLETTRPFQFDGLDRHRLAMVVLAPLPWIPRILFNVPPGVGRLADKKIDAARARRKAAEPTPVQTELANARANLQRLYALPSEHQSLKEVTKAIKDTQELVSELEKFPQQMSAKASRLLAREILDENKDLRDRPKALIAADDEIQDL